MLQPDLLWKIACDTLSRHEDAIYHFIGNQIEDCLIEGSEEECFFWESLQNFLNSVPLPALSSPTLH